MPTYRTNLRRSRRGNQFAPAIVGAIGEGLKGFATGMQQKHQQKMDIEQSRLAQQRAEEESRSNKAMEDWRTKQTALEESKLNDKLAESSVSRAQRRDTVLRLESYLTENPEGLSDKELRAARIVLKTAGTSLDPDKLVGEFYKAIFDAGKPISAGAGSGKDSEMSDSEIRLRTNKMIDLETQNVEAEQKRLEQEKQDKIAAIVPPTGPDGKEDWNAVDSEEARINAAYDAKISALVSGSQGKPGLSQRFSPEGYQAALDSTKMNLFAPPRLKESLAVLAKPRPNIAGGETQPSAPPQTAKIGTVMPKTSGRAMTSFDQPAGESTVSDEQLLQMNADQVPDDLLDRYIQLLEQKQAEEEAR